VTTTRDALAAELRAAQPDLTTALLLLAQEAGPLAGEPAAAVLDTLRGWGDRVRDRLDASDAGPHAGVVALRSVLGDEVGLRELPGDADDLRASLLPQVVMRRRGLPILVSAVWLDVARRAGIPAHGLGMPGRFLVAVTDGTPDPHPGGLVVVDPASGGTTLEDRGVDALLATAGVARAPGLFAPATVPEIVLRVLNNIRMLAHRHVDARMLLWGAETSMLVPGHPPVLVLEVARAQADLGRFRDAAATLTAYADRLDDSVPRGLDDLADAVDPDDPGPGEQLRRQARQLLARLN
jgi:regulator of sirC expression with transglutaminase-like and TPR domain